MTRATKLTVSVLVVLAAFGLAVLAGVTAGPDRDEAFTIDRFDREVELTRDGQLQVIETIEVTFTEPRRGILRDLEGDGPAGPVRYEVLRVDRGVDGEPWNWIEEIAPSGEPRIRIDDADVTLDPGPRTYRLTYRVDGLAFRPADRPDQVRLRLDVPGDAWPVDVAATRLTLRLPAEPTAVSCVVGTAGEVTACPAADTSADTVTQGEDTPLTFAPGPEATEVREWERDALDRLMPHAEPIVFDGEYDATTSRRSSEATSRLAAHAGELFEPGSRYVHTDGGRLRGGGYVLGILATLAFAALVAVAAITLGGLPPVAVVVGGSALGLAWLVLALIWRLERRPLTSEGRDVVARSRAFDRFLREVHADRLDFAGGRDDIGVTHPAVALLPYAVVLGHGASWLERFEPVLVEAARSGRAGGVTGTDTWFLYTSSFAAASTLHSSSITDPASSSAGGGGGAGSGGGGGGGGSW
ncbi:MAG: DUF2207 domain-containing protein [Nitriliruptor sp.]